MSETDFDRFVETYRQALQEFVRGNHGPVAELTSERDDVTLANPLGPPHRGPTEVRRAGDAAAANFTGGSMQFEEVSRYATADLGYVVELERTEVRLAGSEEMARISLRVTVIFRREGDAWKVVHRHADPMTAARPISAIVET
jgi:ketosteroid isomerase-like protein